MRKTASTTLTQHPTVHEGQVGRNEIDNHADTICAGPNWRVLEFTGQFCSVAPFSMEYSPKVNVPVAKCASTYLCPTTGQSVLLIVDQALWFGDDLHTSLINPHQIRSFGYSVCDDQWDPHRALGIDTESFFIAFHPDGPNLYFESRVPTLWELDNLFPITLTAPYWDPSGLSMPSGNSPDFRVMDSIATTISESINVLSHISSSFDERFLCSLKTDALSLVSAAVTGTATGTTLTSISAAITSDRHAKVTPENLAAKWNVGIETAKRTLQVTTQRGIRTAIHPVHRRYRVDHLHLNRRRLNGDWFTDTLFSKVISLKGNSCAQVFTNGYYTSVHPLPSKSKVSQALTEFADDTGIPDTLISDGATEMTGPKTEFMKEVNRLRIRLRRTEVGRKNQNHAAEREIGELKRRWRNRMLKKRIPKRLWDYGLTYEAGIMNRIPRGSQLRTGLEAVTGQTPDISEWLDFEFYDRVWVYDHSKIQLDGTGRRLGRWLGVAHRVGSDLCYWILVASGNVIARTTVQHVAREDILNEETKKQIAMFDENVDQRLNEDGFYVDGPMDSSFFIQDEDSDQYSGGVVPETPDKTDYGDMIVPETLEADDLSDDLLDKYLNAELIFDIGTGSERRGRVTKRAKTFAGDPIGHAHANPLFDTREYVVEFTDGSTENYFANVIAENMFSQIDSEGNQYQLLKEIIDHKSDGSAVALADGYVISRNGNRVPKHTTRGWSLLVSWKDGSSDWVKLKDIKDAYPVQVAEYAIQNRIAEQPAFNWWVHNVLRKRNRIISKAKSRYWKTTHKFGIRIPKSVEEALALDDETGTDFWRKALGKEMTKVKVAWRVNDNFTPEQVRAGKATDMIGFQEIKCHVIFDVKMDFTRKARFVAGGHLTDTPSSVTYSSVVSRNSIRLAFLIAGLNDLDVLAGDVTNAYLNAPCREKIWFEGQVETGPDAGKVLVITRALYGLKSSGAAWRADLAATLRDIGFSSTRADPDVWIKPKESHYEMILVYVDDILIFAKAPREIMDELGKLYELKPESVKEPDIYLGANIERVQLPNGKSEWGMSARTYVKNAVKVVEALLLEEDPEAHLKSTARNPFPTNYKPELDVTTELDDDGATRFLQLIGILRWAVELGRMDIFVEVSQLSQHQALPPRGHLEAAYHIFAFLKKRVVFDPREPVIDERVFNTDADWTDFYGNVTEELPPNMPQPRGKAVVISCFVDANHAGNVVTRRSHTGILVYVQNAPILWFSKRQNTVESSSFGSEFVALRIAKEMIVALRYKLRMFGVPIIGPANVFCDNNGVVKNTSMPQSTLMKKHNAINYHAIREAVAAKILRVGKEDGMTNLADLFTKILTADRRRALCRHIIY
ncbi:Reverse transcriptase (RNA-dependent DNA polymerase) [Fragilaria crotonensis]|nr:Reverse transcriptase (RNA-dependent DNA polymerase) [Fragilaria crotonensis]